MTVESLANNAITTLSANINNSVTSLTVASNTPFPSTGQYRIIVDSEIMLVTGGLGTTTWTVTRGTETTVAASHSAGATVTHIITAGALGNLAPSGYWPKFSPSGSTGANAPSAYAGATSSGKPTSGTWNAGDSVADVTYGGFWTAIVGGTPGTWKGNMNNPYWCSMYRSAAQNITNGTPSNVQFDTIDSGMDLAGMCTTGASAHVTAPITGLYSVTLIGQVSSVAATNALVLSYEINGGGQTELFLDSGVSFADAVRHTVCSPVKLNANDQLTMQIQQNSGSTLSIAGSRIWVELIRFL